MHGFIDEMLLGARRKNATTKTKRINNEVYRTMNKEGLRIEQELAAMNSVKDVPYPIIWREGSPIPIWDLRRYAFLCEEPWPETVNPKLWEQGKMNMHAGLFQVTDNIFQIRGYDLANISFVRGETGWIVIDCLTSQETAQAAIDLLHQCFGEIPVSAVIFSHSHVDHYGGILGVLANEANENIPIHAPKGFTKAVIEENINAGIAMSRRGLYMYGELLLRDGKGQVDCGIGKYVSTGTVTFIDNVQEILQPDPDRYVEKVIDGVTMQFLLTLDTEAPSEMDIYIPSEKSLCIAENCTATLHNIYTLRGAEVRDPVAWAADIQKAINFWGDELTSVFEVHNWPRFGNAYCIDYMEKQRDMYQYINDQSLRLINRGYTLDEVGRMVKFPESLSEEWYNGSYYGTVNHNAKACYQRYMGWYNSNPVDLNRLPQSESAPKYVEYMGGADQIIRRARVAFEEGEYQWVAEVTKQVIFADPDNREAKLLCADALEQLGYVAESGPWRNEYLMGAQELRYGIIPINRTIITDEVLDAIPLENVLYLFSIRVDGIKAGNFNYKINFIIPDREAVASTEIKRGIFRYLSDEFDPNADVTVTMSQYTLYELAITNNRPDNDKIIIDGDACVWHEFLWVQDQIDLNFNIMTPIENQD